MAATTSLYHLHVPTAATVRFGWPRKLVAVVMVLIGTAFVAICLAANLFSVGPAFDRLTSGFRPIMTQQSIQLAQRNVQGLSAAGTEIQTRLLPALAQQLHMTRAQAQQMMASQYPDVTNGLAQVKPITQSFSGLLNTLDRTRPLFVSADAIPTKDIGATSVPWALLVVGLGVIGLGAFAWFSPRLRGPVAALVVGAALVALPLSMNLVTKATNADKLNAELKPVYNQTLIDNANGALRTLSAMGSQLQQQMLPAMAASLHTTPAALNSMLQANFPTTATALKTMPSALAGFRDMTGRFDRHLGDYNTLKPTSFEPIVWFMIASGAVLFTLGGAGLLVGRRAVRR
jgi:hypothetical protein